MQPTCPLSSTFNCQPLRGAAILSDDDTHLLPTPSPAQQVERSTGNRSAGQQFGRVRFAAAPFCCCLLQAAARHPPLSLPQVSTSDSILTRFAGPRRQRPPAKPFYFAAARCRCPPAHRSSPVVLLPAAGVRHCRADAFNCQPLRGAAIQSSQAWP